ncbi:MAG: hypothetical protein JWP85_1711 [Rhodoglobus sp.]|nr:hypothetical protein [Rhodoglobus sp.]
MDPALREVSVTYGAVGATRAPDLLIHPPAGFRPIERRARIGHGEARFAYACAQLMSWGVQKNSGLRVETDGAPQLEAGDSATLVVPVLGRISVAAPVRVVYVVEEPTHRGFAYGTLPGHPESGEEAFVVNQRDDGSVWITVRAFSRPSSRRWWMLYPALRLMQELITRRYLRALAGPID